MELTHLWLNEVIDLHIEVSLNKVLYKETLNSSIVKPTQNQSEFELNWVNLHNSTEYMYVNTAT